MTATAATPPSATETPQVPDEPSVNKHNLPIRRVLRKQIDECCRRDDELNAFVLDFFPQTYSQFSRGMTRNERTTLLLEDEDNLPDVIKAIEAIRFDHTTTPPPIPLTPIQLARSMPRAYKGKQEQEIIIEDDFSQISPEKISNWLHAIQHLIGYELKIVLRNCRAGSVILTLRGDWRGLSRLMDKFVSGQLQSIHSYRVLEVRWTQITANLHILPRLRAEVRAQQMRCYLAIGHLLRWLRTAAVILRVPRWAVASVMFLVLTGAAWAMQKTIRILVASIIVLTRRDSDENKADFGSKEKRMRPFFYDIARQKEGDKILDLSSSFDLLTDDRLDAGSENHDLAKKPIVNIKEKHASLLLEVRNYNVNIESSRNINRNEYELCRKAGKCKGPSGTSNYDTSINGFLGAAVFFKDAEAYCKYSGGRLLTTDELISVGQERNTGIVFDWTAEGKIANHVNSVRMPIKKEYGYIRCIR